MKKLKELLKKFWTWLKETIKNLFTKKDKRNPIERRIDDITERMKNYDEYSDDYRKMVENLTTLTEANANFKEAEKKFHICGDTVFNGVIAFAQIIVILLWEERHVIRSEATKFMTKLWGRK